MNKIILVGRLTKDPELQTTNNGTSLLRFNVACKSKMRDEDGEQKVDFFVCVAWREKAELIHKYCKKGSMLQQNKQFGKSMLKILSSYHLQMKKVPKRKKRPQQKQNQKQHQNKPN